MAVNVTITGDIYDGSETQFTGAEVAYQVYFYNGAGGGSSSIWSDVRYSISGQYNFNLADADLLTTGGNASDGDEVVVVFWTPNTSDRVDSCGSLSSWSVFNIVLGTGPGKISSDTYVNDVQVKPNICPTLSWTLDSTGFVDTNASGINNSTDTHSWTISSGTMYHTNSLRTTLMTINDVVTSNYSWGDGTPDDTLSGTLDAAHQYAASGDYDVELVIEDDCGCTVTGTEQIRVYNRSPVPNIVMSPTTPDPNEVITFQYTGTDIDDAITNIAWTIADSGAYGNTDTTAATNARDDVISHSEGLGTDWYGQSSTAGAFTNPGSHQVSIVVSWWDGFNTQTINYNEIYTQGRFTGPTVNFTQLPLEAVVASEIIFTNTSSDVERVGLGLPNNKEYTWTWTDAAVSEIESDKSYNYQLSKTPTSANCQVELCAEWSDGWDTQNTCVEKDVVFETIVTVSVEDCYYNLDIIGTSDDGSVTGYGWTVYSGSSSTGPWSETWASPVAIEQISNKVCFCVLGFYKIEGTVYGTGASTSDNEIIEVLEVCIEPPPDTVNICPPEVLGRYDEGTKKVTAKEITPSLRGRMSVQPSPRTVQGPYRPFPGPTNI